MVVRQTGLTASSGFSSSLMPRPKDDGEQRGNGFVQSNSVDFQSAK